MKRLPTGVIVFDTIDVICIFFSVGSGIACIVRTYRSYRKRKPDEDPIVTELKQKSPITMFSEKGKPLKFPLMRGGEDDQRIKIFSLFVSRNRKLSKILMSIVTAKRREKLLRLLSNFFFHFNNALSLSFGLRFAVGGSLNYTQILLVALPSTVGGYVVGMLLQYPILGVLGPLAILFGREIEDIPDPYAKCRFLCKAAEEYHNTQLRLEMEHLRSLAEDAANTLQLPIDQVPLLCEEHPLSLVERYKLKALLKNSLAQKRARHFSKFIKKFPECDADPKAVYDEIFNSNDKIKLLK